QPEKKGWLAKFFRRFNKVYDKTAKGYQGILARTAGRRTLTFGLLIAFFAATWGMGALLPSGFIPTEDQGMIYVNVTTPPGATVDRTEAVLTEIDKISRNIGAVETVSTLGGYSLVNEVSGASYGMGMINLVAWEDRKESVTDIIAELREKTAHIMDAEIEFFPPPTVPGFGNSSGFELRLLDKTGNDDLNATAAVMKTFMDDLKATPEVGNVFTSFDVSFPQYELHVDYDMAAKKGVSVENAMATLQTLMGSYYATNFIRYGQMYKVMVQAGPGYREKPEDVLKLYMKNEQGEMLPFSSFMTMNRVYGPEQITRYNMFPSAMLNGDAAEGFSSGEVIDAVERVSEKLPQGYNIEWSGMTREQIISGNQALYIFALCLLFVYLILAAQYESFLLPLPVLLSLPAGVFGAFFFLKIFGLENNIYAQVALVMLIGLLGKNAILIVEYAILKQKQGMGYLQAAIEGAVARLRPILMTSFAFVAGLIPLMFASGAGALGNRSIGVASVGGMLIGTIIGVLVIPGLYVLFSKSKKKTQSKLPLIIAPLILLSFGACSVKNEVKEYRHQVVPEAFHASLTDTQTVGNKSWKELFKDKALIALIDTALLGNKDLRQALHRIEQAKAKLRLRKNALLPNINLVADAGLNKYGFYTMDGIGNYDTNFSSNLKEDEKLPDPLPNYFLGLQTSWEVDVWGKLKNKKAAALNDFLATYEGQKLVQTELITQIATAYFELQSLDDELKVYNKNIELQQKALEVIEVKKEVGTADELGVQQFRAILFNSQAKKEEVQQQIQAYQNQINFLCGRYEGDIAISGFFVHDNLFESGDVGLPLQLLANRPDVRQAALLLKASKHDTRVAELAFLPTISLSPYIGLHAFDTQKFFDAKSLTWGLLGGITAPVFNQRAIRSDYEFYKAAYGVAFEEYEKTALRAFKEVKDGIYADEYIRKRKVYIAQETEALQLSVDAARELFIAGRINYLDILNAQKSVLNAEINNIAIRKELLLNQINLYKALGGGWR
ncbi:MAG: efflux transporter outer membrane subunit, partial [Pedobacter sp.]